MDKMPEQTRSIGLRLEKWHCAASIFAGKLWENDAAWVSNNNYEFMSRFLVLVLCRNFFREQVESKVGRSKTLHRYENMDFLILCVKWAF